MDTSRYLQLFVAECREMLQALNAGILALEASPDDGAVLDEVFRHAHSLKGVSSTMGYDAMALLTHEMEHVLDMVRAGTGSVGEELTTVLLSCLDQLEGTIDDIADGGEGQFDVAPLRARLHAIIGAEAPVAQEAATPAAVVDEADDDDVAALVAAADAAAEAAGATDPASDSADRMATQAGDVSFVAELTLEDDAVASIRAFMIFTALQQYGDIVESTPTMDEVDDFEGTHLRIVIDPGGQPYTIDQVALSLERIAEVASVRITVLEPEPGSAGSEVPAADDAAPVASPAAEVAPEPAAEAATAGEQAAPVGGGEAQAPVAAPGAGTPRRTSETVRIEAARLDRLMHLIGEVVVDRTHVESEVRRGDLSAAAQALQDLRRSTQALQAEVMNVRMVPVETVFVRMPRLVRDLASRLGKQVQLQIEGADTEIDRSVVDALSEPLVHMVRNAVDHGVETPDDRRQAGKAPQSMIRIAARHSGGNVVISVEDDGRGVNVAAVGTRAVERGLLDASSAQGLSIDDAIELLFAPGFSTATQTTDISGRGVGMDAVRAACRALGGDVTMTSDPGKGSTAQLVIPLTLAVMTVLLVETGGLRVALPIDRVERTVRLADHRITTSGALSMLVLDEETLEVRDLGEHVGYGVTEDPRYGVVVRGHGGQRRIVSVSRLVGEQETVTRPLPRLSGDRSVFMGGSVQSDGTVVLIANCDSLFAGDTVAAGGYHPMTAAGKV